MVSVAGLPISSFRGQRGAEHHPGVAHSLDSVGWPREIATVGQTGSNAGETKVDTVESAISVQQMRPPSGGNAQNNETDDVPPGVASSISLRKAKLRL